MIKEMLGIAEGILQDLHNDHEEVASLLEAIADSEDGWERNSLFQQMRAKLLTHSHAEDEVLYRRLRTSEHETSRKFAEEGEREHQLRLAGQPDPTMSAGSSGAPVPSVTRGERKIIVILTDPALIDGISPDRRRIEILQDHISTVATNKIVPTGARHSSFCPQN